MPDVTLPAPAERFVPHRPPMLLLDRLVARTSESGTVEARPSPASIFAGRDGLLDPAVAVELMAQAYAAWYGYGELLSGGDLGPGFLVGARRVSILAPLPAGEVLVVTVRGTGSFDRFVIVEGEVRCEGQLLATGTIKLWIPGSGREAPP
jgi:predicted hotdog family 3-hydroxylacyl-ACP dehydratase